MEGCLLRKEALRSGHGLTSSWRRLGTSNGCLMRLLKQVWPEITARTAQSLRIATRLPPAAQSLRPTCQAHSSFRFSCLSRTTSYGRLVSNGLYRRRMAARAGPCQCCHRRDASLNVDTLSFQLWPWDALLHRWSCAMRRTIALGSQSAHVSASVALVGHKRERNPDAYM